MAVTGNGVKGLVRETRDVLLQPVRYFSAMQAEGTIGSAMLKVFVYSVIVLVLSCIANLLFRRPGFGFGAMISFPLIGVLALFIGAAILMVCSLLCGGKTGFTLNARIAASLSALCVVQALITLPVRPGSLFSMLLWLAVTAYGIVLLYFALVHGLAANEGRAKMLSGAIAGIFVLFGVATFAAQVFLKNMPDKIAGIAAEQSGDLRVAEQKLQKEGYTEEDLKLVGEYQNALVDGDEKNAKELLAKMREREEKRNAAKE